MSTITVEEGLENLQAMFPSFEKDTLATLLQTNNNNLSATIEVQNMTKKITKNFTEI